MTPFEPRDPEYEIKVRRSFAKQGAMETIGAKIARIKPGEIVLEMPFSQAVTQQHGFVHAGIITSLLDSASGYAAYSLMVPDAEVLTIEFKTNLMAPAKGERFRAIGKVVKPGRTIMFCESEVFAISSDGEETHIATMSATMMVVTGRSDVKN